MPKLRRVIVTLEVETCLPLSDLRRPFTWDGMSDTRVIQAQANVVQRKPAKKAKRRR